MSKQTLTHLPIDDFIPEILKQKAFNNNLVITASPGAGKTTRLPPALLSTVSGKIFVLEPRRMAAMAAAHRIAEENKWTVGDEVGYQVRFLNKTSPQSRLIFMTEALLAREMIHNPELQGVDIVILDEFHERSLYVDLTLGLLRELQELGRNIKIIVMSATLESEKISQYLGNAPIISVPGKLFKLTVKYQKLPQLLKTQSNFYENLERLIKEAEKQTDKDILVFLPGAGEIERTKENLSDWAENKNIEIITLHGNLPLEIQQKALQKHTRKRIILSTNIAESSVTLDGVNTVIDTGLAKVMKQDYRTGFSRLELSRISLASAIQRSGRAARQFPGVSYRMWNQTEELLFTKSELPEIMRTDLSESLLFLAAQGIRDFENFTWFEKPATVSFKRAIQTLQSAGAINEKNEVLDIGHQILHFPLPIRLGRLLIAGIENNCIEIAAKLAALLQERDVLRKDIAKDFLGDNLECDLTLRLNVLNAFLNRNSVCEGHIASLKTVAQSYKQILQLAKQLNKQIKPNQTNRNRTDSDARQLLLLASYSDRLCRRRKTSDRALMVGGRGVKLSNETLVKKSEFFVSISGVEGSSESETLISLASGIEKDFLLKQYSDQIVKKVEIIFDTEKEKFYQQEFKALWDLPLEDATLSLATASQVADKLPEILVANWENSLKKSESLNVWWQKLLFLREQKEYLSDPIKNELEEMFDEDLLKNSFCLNAFTQACQYESKISEVFKKNLVPFFENNLSNELCRILHEELPNKLKMPSGSMIPIHYPLGKPAYLEVRIQEIFGWSKTPRVLFNNIPIVLHLLGPNFRPVQITSNLESFWQTGYPEVRKELRIRYPKHQWPENPSDGIAEAKGRRRN